MAVGMLQNADELTTLELHETATTMSELAIKLGPVLEKTVRKIRPNASCRKTCMRAAMCMRSGMPVGCMRSGMPVAMHA